MNNVEEFVYIIENKSKVYTIDKTVNVCKRLKNSKREFLFVNSYQGKHIPQSPSKIIKLFDELVENINIDKSEKVLVIGFAETATAIGNYVASKLENCIYQMQTTREITFGQEPLIEFREEHSHAQEQLLYGDKEKILDADRIIFVEDEITTGKTILNFIKELKKINPNLKYSVASILNWQDEEWSKVYKDLRIETYYIMRGKIKDINAKVNIKAKEECKIQNLENHDIRTIRIKSDLCNFEKTRLGKIPLKDINFYSNYIYNLIFNNSKNLKQAVKEKDDKILVIGTEEFMYEPMLFASCLEEKTNNKIYYHATTRSPIEVSDDSRYALKDRFKLRSCYEKERITYIYNLKKYDKIFIVTDCNPSKEFINDIVGELGNIGCNIEDIEIIIFGG